MHRAAHRAVWSSGESSWVCGARWRPWRTGWPRRRIDCRWLSGWSRRRAAGCFRQPVLCVCRRTGQICSSMSLRTEMAMTSSSSRAMVSRFVTGLAFLLRVVKSRRVRTSPWLSCLWPTKITGISSNHSRSGSLADGGLDAGQSVLSVDGEQSASLPVNVRKPTDSTCSVGQFGELLFIVVRRDFGQRKPVGAGRRA